MTATEAHPPLPPVKRWVVLWLAISTIVVIWDALFVLLRPMSFPDGSLGFLWGFAYSLYMEVDHAYADTNNTYLLALCTMSLVEAVIVGAALWAHRADRRPLAHLLVVTVTSLTAAKTMLFMLVEVFNGGHAIAHNSLPRLIALWIIPNGIWIVVPTTAAIVTARQFLEHTRNTP